MHRLAYICSLPHSGSTAFSLFLGTHSRLIGLGGIDRAVSTLAEAITAREAGARAPNLPCTCGLPATSCPYWGEVARQLSPGRPPGRKQRYQLALDTFGAVFGEEAWPVDSSKHVEPLAELCALDSLRLRAFHLLKDVRSLTASMIDQARRDKDSRRPGAFLALEYFWRWRRENGKIDRFLAQRKIEAHRIGYEELCLAPETIMAKVSDFLGVPAETGSLCLRESRSHLIIGNRMRTQAGKEHLRYDSRWFSRRDWLLVSVLFPQIRRYNSDAVYSNQSDAVWTR